MKIEIKNKHLVNTINFLDGLNLEGLKSVFRTNLSMKLQEKLKVVDENIKQLRKEAKGNERKLRKWIEELNNQSSVIDGGDSTVMLNSVKATIKKVIENAENEELPEEEKQKFSGGDAYGLAALYEAFQLGGDK